MSYFKKLSLVMGLMLIVGGAWYLTRPASIEELQTENATAEEGNIILQGGGAVSGQGDDIVQTVAGKSSTQPAFDEAEISQLKDGFKDFQYNYTEEEMRSFVGDYTQLQSVVLPSEEQIAKRKSMLQDERMLADLAAKLSSTTAENYERDTVIVDYLIDTLQETPEVVRPLLAKLIADNQIENADHSPEQRTYQAQLKGELLYYWMAYEPDQLSTIEQLLPGPVSRRIYSNAQEIQQQNLRESSMYRSGQ